MNVHVYILIQILSYCLFTFVEYYIHTGWSIWGFKNITYPGRHFLWKYLTCIHKHVKMENMTELAQITNLLKLFFL